MQIKIEQPMDLAQYIEHTLVRSDATRMDITKLCEEAKKFNFLGVCVNPIYVQEAAQKLDDSNCLVISVVGFPLGANLTSTKVEEAKQVIKNGADEIDMVISLGALKNNDYKFVYNDIKSVVDTVKPVPVKVIIESSLLNKSEKINACLLALKAGASFLKTSTGFAYVKTSKGFEIKGATVEDIRLIKSVVDNKMGIKASGGIADYRSAKALVNAGATRIGCSSSVSIVTNSPNDCYY
jgi:deoxyribose-phosphate aldolase